jgi:hypothetical protein
MPYEIELKGGAVEHLDGADAYAQEGTLTTFFRGRDGRCVLDPWAKRLASYRTADIVRVRWYEPTLSLAEEHLAPTSSLRDSFDRLDLSSLR